MGGLSLVNTATTAANQSVKKKRFFNNANDSFEVCDVEPSYWTLTILFPSTECCPELKKHLNTLISVDCHTMLVIFSDQNLTMTTSFEMETQIAHFREWNGLCRQC